MNIVVDALTRAGACAAGAVALWRIEDRMTPDGLEQARRRTPGLKSLLCAAFPYGPEDCRPGRFSLYARGQDYHRVVVGRLEAAAEALETAFPGCRFDPWADASPFPEVYAGALAGLGLLGENGLLITPAAGSYVFLGFLATDAAVPETAGEIRPCRGCGACRRACPGKALEAPPPDRDRCLSALTQRRGRLEDWQEALIAQNGALWGCDRCQLVCPENARRTAPPLPEFAPLPDPPEHDFSLGDRAFRRKYAGRAFIWRGVQPLRRNAALLSSPAQTPQEEPAGPRQNTDR